LADIARELKALQKGSRGIGEPLRLTAKFQRTFVEKVPHQQRDVVAPLT